MCNGATASEAAHQQGAAASSGPSLGLRLSAYGAFFISGGTSLVFEVLWSRQFVTVLGASTYAISVVLCAFMAGLGLGGWLGGHLADRFRGRLLAYGAVQMGVAFWALAMPLLLGAVGQWVPRIAILAPGSVLLPMAARFFISFGILLVPCALMGATLPLLSRFCAASLDVVGRRVGLLYALNTLGATGGCFAAGHWLIGTFGLSVTNRVAVAANLIVGAMAAALGFRERSAAAPPGILLAAESAEAPAAEPGQQAGPWMGRLILLIAFMSGLAALSSEVLWLRYLGPLSNVAYTFPTVLGIYLFGIGAGSLVYRFFVAALGRPLRFLPVALLLLGVAVAACFVLSASVSLAREAGPLALWPMSALVVLAPTLVMGTAFPLICAAYARSVSAVGRSIGLVYAVNTLGAIVGSLLPVFVLIPAFGIQRSIFLISLLYGVGGAVLLVAWPVRGGWLRSALGGTVALCVVFGLALFAPADVCQNVILATAGRMVRHRDVIFYREGKTSTEAIVQDKVSRRKYLFMNGAIEVTTAYPEMVCFKLMGALGPLLHPEPNEVLMVCFGGGIASGAATRYPEVMSLLAVDLEGSVVEGARLLAEENNSVLSDPKFRIAIDDGRNYVLMSGKRWPVIVSDSLHPKSSDAWVLYTREFYQTMKDHLTDDGIFVQWVPYQRLSVAEYQSVVRTFQSVFPHASLWFTDGVSETGVRGGHTHLVGMPERLSVDVAALRRKLSAADVAADLRPWGMDTPVAVLETFVCGEERLRQWTGSLPLNTDDMPYVQYRTKLSGGPECTDVAFLPLLESVWPYLRNVGDHEEATRLERELALHLEASRLVLQGRLAQALALLPQDPKLRQSQQNTQAAVEWIERVSEYYPDSPLALMSLAARAMGIPGNWSQSVALYERALLLDPRNAVARQNLGFALAAQGRLDEAIAQYRAALRIAPRSATAHSNLGMALAAQERLDEAAAALSEALRLDPKSASAHRALGNVLAQQGKPQQATRHFAEALKIEKGADPSVPPQ